MWLPFPRLFCWAGCSCGRFLSLCRQGGARASSASSKAETSLALPWPWPLASDTGVGQSCATEHIIFVTEYIQAVVSSSNCFWGQWHSLQGLPTAKAVIDSPTVCWYTQQGQWQQMLSQRKHKEKLIKHAYKNNYILDKDTCKLTFHRWIILPCFFFPCVSLKPALSHLEECVFAHRAMLPSWRALAWSHVLFTTSTATSAVTEHIRAQEQPQICLCLLGLFQSPGKKKKNSKPIQNHKHADF